MSLLHADVGDGLPERCGIVHRRAVVITVPLGRLKITGTVALEWAVTKFLHLIHRLHHSSPRCPPC